MAGSGTLLDARGLAKPASFSGTEDGWKDLSFVYMSYVAMLDHEIYEAMVAAAERDREIDVDSMAADLQIKGRTLYHMLVMLVKGRAMQILRSAASGNGFET